MGFVRKTPAGTFRACWRDPAGGQKSKSFRTKREAVAFLTEVESGLNRGTYVNPHAGRTRFGDFAQQWLATRAVERVRPSALSRCFARTSCQSGVTGRSGRSTSCRCRSG